MAAPSGRARASQPPASFAPPTPAQKGLLLVGGYFFYPQRIIFADKEYL